MSKLQIKTALKYHLSDYRNAVLIMYLCVYLAVIAILVFNANISSSGGLEMASMITIFVVGLNSFKENFKFFSANGVSRKTQLCSTIASLGTLSAIFALIDTINGIIFTHVMVYRPMLVQAYGPRYGYALDVYPYSSPVLTAQILAEDFLWLLCTCFFVSMVGLWITTLFYRMNRGLKIAVGIAVPVLLLNGLPFLDELYFGGAFVKALTNAARAAWGFSGGYNPYIGMFSMLVFSGIFAALTFLLARKAAIKK
ncbi:MAG: hypothetical protein K0Q85_1382 [Caproiciproducens sp.]|nr:hypothetical protein [Caproiciproducens sp.]